MIDRRNFVAGALATVGPSSASDIVWAQAYPARPVHLIVGYAPGGANDIVARLIGRWLSERFGQTFVIENRPGAASNIATEAVVNSLPDGYTLLLVNASNAINATLYEKLGYNFIRDIVPVAGIMRVPNVMARLFKAPVRRTQGGARLSVALYPSGRYRQQPADRMRPGRRRLQVQGLPRRRPRAIQADDARHR
jgi:tripartite-type tricarboxylate transporter receptor subunit TctC